MRVSQPSARLVLLTLVNVIGVSAACGSNPTNPAPVCTEAGASNVGDPLPCQFPAPTVDSVTVKGFMPQPGPNTKLRTSIVNWDTGVVIPGDKFVVTSRFALRQETVDEATAAGEEVILVSCLSKDGNEPTPDTGNGQCMLTRVTAISNGETNHALGVDHDAGITETTHVWVTFALRPVGSTNYKKVSRYFGGRLEVALITWIPQ